MLSFDSEEESFEAFANTFPTDSSFLIDTYNTISGLDKAIKIAKRLRLQGREIAGIRLDSGDLAELSKACRDKLDRNGFPRVPIIASNDLDEYAIEQLKSSNSCISIWESELA